MSTSIYDISDWEQGNSYQKYDIIAKDGLFYYAVTDIPQGTAFSTAYFGGTKLVNGTNRPVFLWSPSYNGQKTIEPKINSIQFGDGYEQRSPDGINNILLKFEYSFSERKLSEATAILHFLHERQGTEWFYFTPEKPFNQEKKFVCKNWTENSSYYNNHLIRANFVEVVA